jgi:hypothetical protein
MPARCRRGLADATPALGPIIFAPCSGMSMVIPMVRGRACPHVDIAVDVAIACEMSTSRCVKGLQRRLEQLHSTCAVRDCAFSTDCTGHDIFRTDHPSNRVFDETRTPWRKSRTRVAVAEPLIQILVASRQRADFHDNRGSRNHVHLRQRFVEPLLPPSNRG